MLGYSYLRLGFRKLVINWQKSERKWNSLGMPVDRKRLPDGLMQSFLIYVQPHQSDKTKWPSRQFCWKLTGSRHLCFGDVTWPRFRDNCRRLGQGALGWTTFVSFILHGHGTGTVPASVLRQRWRWISHFENCLKKTLWSWFCFFFSFSRLIYKYQIKDELFSNLFLPNSNTFYD